MFYTKMIHAVLLYGSETWFIYLCIEKTLGCFHYWVIRHLTGQMSQWNRDRTWSYPPLEEALSEAVMQEVEIYIDHHKNTVAQLIATRPNMGLCLVAARRPGAQVSERWW